MFVHQSVRSVAAEAERKEKRVGEMLDRFDYMIRESLRKAVCRLKDGHLRKPLPEPRQLFSDVFRAHRRPARQLGELLVRMKEDGLSHHDARVFMATTVAFVDSIYEQDTPPVEELAPRLVLEDAQASAAEMRALCTKNPADFARALDERMESHNLAAILLRRLQQEATTKYRTITAAVR